MNLPPSTTPCRSAMTSGVFFSFYFPLGPFTNPTPNCTIYDCDLILSCFSGFLAGQGILLLHLNHNAVDGFHASAGVSHVGIRYTIDSCCLLLLFPNSYVCLRAGHESSALSLYYYYYYFLFPDYNHVPLCIIAWESIIVPEVHCAIQLSVPGFELVRTCM